MIREVKVNYAIGCVYNEDKEVMLFPGLSRVWKNEEFNINEEFNWISKGIDTCFPKDIVGNILVNLMRTEYAWNRKQNALKPFVISVHYTDNGQEVLGAMEKLNSKLQSFEYYIEKGYSIATIDHALSNLENKEFQKTYDLFGAVGYVFEQSKQIVYYPVSVLNNVRGLRNLNITLKEISKDTDLKKYKENNMNPDKQIKKIEEKLSEKYSYRIRIVLGAIEVDTKNNVVNVLKYCHDRLGVSRYLELGYKCIDGSK